MQNVANIVDPTHTACKVVHPNGSDNLLEWFGLDRLCERALKLPPIDYNANVPGDRSLYRGAGAWSLFELTHWPPSSTYSYPPIVAEDIKAALQLQPGPASLPEEWKGELVVAAPSLAEGKAEKKKKDKKEKKEKKDKKSKKEKKEKKRKRDDVDMDHSSQWTQGTQGTQMTSVS